MLKQIKYYLFYGTAAEDDWEEEHEKMAVLLELEDPHLLPSDLGSAPGRKYKTRQEVGVPSHYYPRVTAACYMVVFPMFF